MPADGLSYSDVFTAVLSGQIPVLFDSEISDWFRMK